MRNSGVIRTRANNANTVRIVGTVFAVLSVVFLLIGIIAFVATTKAENSGDEIEATVTRIEEYSDSDGDRNYRVFVSYTYNGTLYEDVRLDFYDSSTYEGNTITLVVDPKNPTKVLKKGEAIFFLLIFGFFFLVFGSIGFTILGVTASGEGKKKRLMENGRLVHAVVEGIELNTFITVNGMNPYNVFCGYVDPATGEKIEFKSNNLYFNPNEFYELGSYIDVYVDQDNYKKYYVDVRNKALEGNYNM